MRFLPRSDRERRLEALLRDLLAWAQHAERKIALEFGDDRPLQECGSMESEIVNAARFLRDSP